MPRSTSYVCIGTERENNVTGPFIYVTSWACPSLCFIFSGPERRTFPGSPPSSWLGWAKPIPSPCGLLKNQSRMPPIPGYVISDNPCQARLPTASARVHTARLSTTWSNSSQWLHEKALECQEWKQTHLQEDCVEDVTVTVTPSETGGHCTWGLLTAWWRWKTRPKPQCKASISSSVRWHEQNGTECDYFLHLPVCSSLILSPGFLIVQTRSPHGVVLISDPRLDDFIINSVFNLQSKEKLFLSARKWKWLGERRRCQKGLPPARSQRHLFTLIVLYPHLDISLLLSALLNQVHSLVFSSAQPSFIF